MIPNAKSREVLSNGVEASSSFGISMKDATHIMTILRDTLYSDKVLAVLREYSANAWDANREAGKMDTPIKITMPTRLDPALVIQDFGLGLSRDDVFNVYTQYGASTKRDSDLAVGMLGIGSKSGFAYSDSFTVISCHGGKRCTYVAVLDDSDAGTIQLLHEEECDETGVSIKIAIRPDDIREFEQKARSLFQYFTPRPNINLELPPPATETVRLKNGVIYEDQSTWIAVMGCVPYRINLDQIRGRDPAVGAVGEYIFKMAGALYFNIGEVEINASREELKYSEKTKSTLVAKFNDLIDEFVQHTMDAIEKDSLTTWDKRLRAQVFNRLGLPIPPGWAEYTKSYLNFPLPADTKFILVSTKNNPIGRVSVVDKFRILISDDKRNLKGFSFGHHDVIAVPKGGYTTAEVLADVEARAKEIGMEGVVINLLSEIPWHPIVNGRQVVRTKDKKHRVKTFVVDVHVSHHHPFSRGWSIVDRTPDDGDVFVVLNSFKASRGYDFYIRFSQDKALAKAFGVPLPPIYGYKDTAKKPVADVDCKGTEYREWRKKFHQSLLTPEVNKLMVLMHQVNAGSNGCENHWSIQKKPYVGHLKTLIDALGSKHPITQLYVNQVVAKRKLQKISKANFNAVLMLSELLHLSETNPAVQAFEALLAQYPLFNSTYGDNFDQLWGHKRQEDWAHYVRLVDKFQEEKENDDESTTIHNHE